MSISFNRLCEYFNDKIYAIYINKDIDIYFDDVELVTKQKDTYLENYIYIGQASMFKGNANDNDNVCLILINDNYSFLREYDNDKIKIIEINKNEDIVEIYNEVKAIFRRDARYNLFKISLLEIILRGKGLNELIETASKLIGNPLVVIDLCFKILANSSVENITDMLWKDNVKKGYCSYEFINEVRKLESIKKSRKAKRPFEFTCYASPTKKVIYRIEVEGKVIGNILLLECKKKIVKDDSDYLVLISDMVSKELAKEQFYKNTKNVLTEEIIYDLLENKIENKAIIKERLKNGSLCVNDYISVIIVDVSHYKLKHSIYARYLSSSLLNFFPMSKSIYYNDNIVLILNSNEHFIEKNNDIERVQQFLSKNNLKMGISNEFSKIENCNIYYHQAVDALKIGKILEQKKCIYKYKDIQPYKFIYLKKDDVIKEDFYNDSLYALKKYDNENNSKLYETLYIYLKNNHNITKTSNEMFIHRNTLRYRLEKITDIIKLNLDEDDNTFKLYYAFKSMNFYEKLNKEYSK